VGSSIPCQEVREVFSLLSLHTYSSLRSYLAWPAGTVVHDFLRIIRFTRSCWSIRMCFMTVYFQLSVTRAGLIAARLLCVRRPLAFKSRSPQISQFGTLNLHQVSDIVKTFFNKALDI